MHKYCQLGIVRRGRPFGDRRPALKPAGTFDDKRRSPRDLLITSTPSFETEISASTALPPTLASESALAPALDIISPRSLEARSTVHCALCACATTATLLLCAVMPC